jgi:hypothetical protein
VWVEREDNRRPACRSCHRPQPLHDPKVPAVDSVEIPNCHRAAPGFLWQIIEMADELQWSG